MFTGIITHLGKVVSKNPGVIIIDAPDIVSQLLKGASISVDGICFTVVSIDSSRFEINYMPETEAKTNIKYLKENNLVNLELPVTANTLFSGHIVQGHVDAVSKILKIDKDGNSYIFTFSLDPKFSKYVVYKGSISVNGISLTVIRAEKDFFTVGIIPHTWEMTMLHESKIGDYVNIEVDILAKYLEKLLVKN